MLVQHSFFHRVNAENQMLRDLDVDCIQSESTELLWREHETMFGYALRSKGLNP